MARGVAFPAIHLSCLASPEDRIYPNSAGPEFNGEGFGEADRPFFDVR